jgi:hypothetical protein
MIFKIDIKLEDQEVMTALIAGIKALNQSCGGTVLSTQVGQVVELQKEQAKTITIEQVKAKLFSLSQAGKAEQVKALLNKFGAKKLTEVSKKNYAALLKEAETIQ